VVDRVIKRARDHSPNQYWSALDSAIRAFERAGQPDEALKLQRELLTFNKAQKFEQVRRMLGRPSREETQGTVKLVHLGTAVDRKVTDLINAAITQALRSGHNHARIFRVSRLSELFAISEGWPVEQVRALELAAKLIDIGVMVIPDGLLRKPRALSEGERKIVEEHARFGADVLERSRLSLLQPCVPIVRSHHERWDGTGPLGSRGDGVPLAARVVALCDSFDALTHDRPWRRGFSVSTALCMIEERAGSQFDPALSKRFVAWLKDEFWRVDDLEAHLAAEASENAYVRLREHIQRFAGSAA
jgi:response regulator RpfG family c-di-GMP phosphodiesterase